MAGAVPELRRFLTQILPEVHCCSVVGVAVYVHAVGFVIEH